MTELSERIKIVRKNEKLTQNQFGERLSVSGSYVSRLESGKEQPTEMLLKLIALTFDISTDWLLKGEGTMIVTRESNDFFDRGHSDEYINELNDTINGLKQYISDHPDYHISFVLSTMINGLYDTILALSHNQSVGAMIFERIVNINLEIFHQINYLLTNKKNSEAEAYKHLLMLSQSINAELQAMSDIIINYGSLIDVE